MARTNSVCLTITSVESPPDVYRKRELWSVLTPADGIKDLVSEPKPGQTSSVSEALVLMPCHCLGWLSQGGGWSDGKAIVGEADVVDDERPFIVTSFGKLSSSSLFVTHTSCANQPKLSRFKTISCAMLSPIILIASFPRCISSLLIVNKTPEGVRTACLPEEICSWI